MSVRIGIVGDYNPEFVSHTTTDSSLEHAAAALDVDIESRWLPTPTLTGGDAAKILSSCQGIWISAGSPYLDREGAFAAIRFARERDRPLLATCGGFQHVLVEHARNVLGIHDAEHAEDSLDAKNPIIVPVACAVPDRRPGAPKLSGALRIHFRSESKIHEVYDRDAADEEYFCNYEVSPAYRQILERSDARITGVGPDGEIRVLELPQHRFYVATLFQPQRSSRPGAPNPLIRAFVGTALEVAEEKAARGAWP
jgi:CTP synthase (UTP-ammonia lyase)